MAESYRDLVAWQKAMDLVTDVYRITQKFPREEMYGLTGQIRRAAVSIPSNIAEGKGRYSKGELVQFLIQARGSLLELETQLLIAQRLRYFGEAEARTILGHAAETGRILNGLIAAFRKPKSDS